MINQAILSTWMKKHKIKYSVASNGQEAVERWKGGGFHLVLVCYSMDEINQCQVVTNAKVTDGYPTASNGRYRSNQNDPRY